MLTSGLGGASSFSIAKCGAPVGEGVGRNQRYTLGKIVFVRYVGWTALGKGTSDPVIVEAMALPVLLFLPSPRTGDKGQQNLMCCFQSWFLAHAKVTLWSISSHLVSPEGQVCLKHSSASPGVSAQGFYPIGYGVAMGSPSTDKHLRIHCHAP